MINGRNSSKHGSIETPFERSGKRLSYFEENLSKTLFSVQQILSQSAEVCRKYDQTFYITFFWDMM